ncbi:CAT RNA binding domain-containing protein [Clostridium saccharoperbutylacetonicum]
MMVIYKIFNNNAVVIKDEKGVEKIVMGCGLAFKLLLKKMMRRF